MVVPERERVSERTGSFAHLNPDLACRAQARERARGDANVPTRRPDEAVRRAHVDAREARREAAQVEAAGTFVHFGQRAAVH